MLKLSCFIEFHLMQISMLQKKIPYYFQTTFFLVPLPYNIHPSTTTVSYNMNSSTITKQHSSQHSYQAHSSTTVLYNVQCTYVLYNIHPRKSAKQYNPIAPLLYNIIQHPRQHHYYSISISQHSQSYISHVSKNHPTSSKNYFLSL